MPAPKSVGSPSCVKKNCVAMARTELLPRQALIPLFFLHRQLPVRPSSKNPISVLCLSTKTQKRKDVKRQEPPHHANSCPSPGSQPSTPNGQLATSRSTAPAHDTRSRTDAGQTTERASTDAGRCPSNSSTSLVSYRERIRAAAWETSSWMTCDTRTP